jgi:phage gp46-like protein
MAMSFDGDPKIIGAGDCDLQIIDGQPVMDAGLENAVTLSLFCSSNWWGNAIAGDYGATGSVFEDILAGPLTAKTILDAEAAARTSLAWLIDQGIAKLVDAAATIPAVGMLGLAITIEQPDRSIQIRYSINWQTMAVSAGAAA